MPRAIRGRSVGQLRVESSELRMPDEVALSRTGLHSGDHSSITGFHTQPSTIYPQLLHDHLPRLRAENIEGADECESCGKALSHLSLPHPGLQRGSRPAPRPHRAALAANRRRRFCPRRRRRSAQEDGRRTDRLRDDRRRGKLVGIFSERDALMRLNVDAAKLLQRPISQFMTADPVTLEAATRSPSPCTG